MYVVLDIGTVNDLYHPQGSKVIEYHVTHLVANTKVNVKLYYCSTMTISLKPYHYFSVIPQMKSKLLDCGEKKSKNEVVICMFRLTRLPRAISLRVFKLQA